MEKLVSILTVVYNDKSIKQTIDSVIPFLSSEVELVVVDGGSIDGTLELLKSYGDQISKLISEPDKGIYDAMNKAVRIAEGEFVIHINAGDILLCMPIQELKTLNRQNYSGAAFPIKIDGTREHYPHWNWRIKYKAAIHHQGTFYKREIVNYNIQYKIFSDLDLNQRLYKSGLQFGIFDSPFVANHMSNGLSSSRKYKNELYRLILKNSGIVYLVIYIIDRFFIRVFNRESR